MKVRTKKYLKEVKVFQKLQVQGESVKHPRDRRENEWMKMGVWIRCLKWNPKKVKKEKWICPQHKERGRKVRRYHFYIKNNICWTTMDCWHFDSTHKDTNTRTNKATHTSGLMLVLHWIDSDHIYISVSTDFLMSIFSLITFWTVFYNIIIWYYLTNGSTYHKNNKWHQNLVPPLYIRQKYENCVKILWK